MEPKHTKLGIASFLLSIAAAAGLFTVIAIALVLGSIRHVDHDFREVARVIGVLCLCFLVFMDLIAIALGVAGLAQPDCKKLFAVLGTVFAGLQILLTIIVLVARS